MDKPIVGIVAKPLSDFECPGDVWVEDYVKDEFRATVIACGGIPLGVLPPFAGDRYNGDESRAVMQNNLSKDEVRDFERVLALCDGIVLQGGMTGDYYEYHAACYALAHDVPVLGVCAGFNTLCRAAGSDICPDAQLGLDPAFHNVYSTTYRHEVKLMSGSEAQRLFGGETLWVNSLHTQFLRADVAQENPRIVVNATVANRTEAGDELETVEAFTVGGVRFAMGLKWHPELMEPEHRQLVFERFLAACRDR